MKFIKFFIFFLIIISNSLYSRTLLHPVNLNFDQSQEGMVPFGWNFLPQFEKLGYQAFTTKQGVPKGYCLTIQSTFGDKKEIPNPDNKELQAVVYQEINAEYFRGKDVYFAVKYNILNPSSDNTAMIFIQQENNDKEFFRLFNSDTLRQFGWQESSISIRIDSLAKVIKIGLIVFNTAVVQFDDAVFNFIFDFTKNVKNENLNEAKIKNLTDLAKVYGTVRYFYPSPFLKEYPWDNLLYSMVRDACMQDNADFRKNLRTTFSEIAPIPTQNNKKVVSASNYVYQGIPAREQTPLSYQKISDIFVSRKEYYGTLINFVNISGDQPDSSNLEVRYKFKPFAKNAKGGLWLRFDDRNSNSLGEYKVSEFISNSKEWQKASVAASVPQGAFSVRIGLVLEGDGEVLFDNLILKVKKGVSEEIVPVRNHDFESPKINEFIAGWNFPQHSQKAGYKYDISEDAFEGKYSLRLFSRKDDIIQFPDLFTCFEDTLSDGTIYKTPITIPVSELKPFSIPKINQIENFAVNHDDVYSRFAIIIEIWNIMRHFSFKPILNELLTNGLLNAIYEANRTNSLEEFKDVLSNLALISDDLNFKVWYGLDIQSYFPKLGVLIHENKAYSIRSDELGIPSGARIVNIDNVNLDSLFELRISQNLKNTLNLKFLLYKETIKLLSGIENSSKNIEYTLDGKNYLTKKVVTDTLDLLRISSPTFASEIKEGVIYLNSAMMTDEEFLMIIPKLQAPDIKGIIIDLRGYSLLSEHILGLFTDKSLKGYISEVPVYTAPSRTLISKAMMDGLVKSVPKLNDKKVVFLINEFTTSYSEIIVALARLNKIGTVIGSPTQGNITEVDQLVFPGYFFGTQSVMKVRLEGDINYIENTVTPDIRVDQTLKSAITDTDDLLEEAVRLIR